MLFPVLDAVFNSSHQFLKNAELIPRRGLVPRTVRTEKLLVYGVLRCLLSQGGGRRIVEGLLYLKILATKAHHLVVHLVSTFRCRLCQVQWMRMLQILPFHGQSRAPVFCCDTTMKRPVKSIHLDRKCRVVSEFQPQVSRTRPDQLCVRSPCRYLPVVLIGAVATMTSQHVISVAAVG